MLPVQSFKDYIINNELFSKNSKVLLAVSGGRDSVLMVHLFKLSGYDFGIAHCNFNLRAGESQRDETFVRTLASSLEIPLHITHFKTKDYATEHKISTQMAARDLRYKWFEEIREMHNYEVIALAQHLDDAIETVLLNLTRGTGIAGLHGILPKRGKLIRPLLFLSRKEIDRLIGANKIDYVEDSSNLKTDYARNKVRLEVIPHLKQINPNLEQTFEHNIQRFTDTELVLQNAVAELQQILVEKNGSFYLSIDKISTIRPQKLLFFELLRPFGFSEFVVAEILLSLNKQSGTSFYSNTHSIIIDRDQLIISLLNTNRLPELLIDINDQNVVLPNFQILISYRNEPYFEKASEKAFVDAAQLIYPLMVRTRLQGDRFMPIGMKTLKKLSDFLIDEKIPLSEKDQVPLLINGNGDVIWIAGLRQDNRYKITAKTEKMVIFELKRSNYNC